MGTRFTRARTNVRGASRPDEIFISDYRNIKDNVDEWVAIVFSSSLAMKFISKYDGICGEIKQCKKGLHLNYWDQFMISNLDNLMDKLNGVRRRAVAVIEQPPTTADIEMERVNLHVLESSQGELTWE